MCEILAATKFIVISDYWLICWDMWKPYPVWGRNWVVALSVTSTVSAQKLQVSFFAFSQADVRMIVQWEAEAAEISVEKM